MGYRKDSTEILAFKIRLCSNIRQRHAGSASHDLRKMNVGLTISHCGECSKDEVKANQLSRQSKQQLFIQPALKDSLSVFLTVTRASNSLRKKETNN
jgi:hypothetical protein